RSRCWYRHGQGRTSRRCRGSTGARSPPVQKVIEKRPTNAIAGCEMKRGAHFESARHVDTKVVMQLQLGPVDLVFAGLDVAPRYADSTAQRDFPPRIGHCGSRLRSWCLVRSSWSIGMGLGGAGDGPYQCEKERKSNGKV